MSLDGVRAKLTPSLRAHWDRLRRHRFTRPTETERMNRWREYPEYTDSPAYFREGLNRRVELAILEIAASVGEAPPLATELAKGLRKGGTTTEADVILRRCHACGEPLDTGKHAPDCSFAEYRRWYAEFTA